MSLNQKCFCGTDKQFSCCCLPFITKEQIPKTPEQLMRSRFSAYVVANGQYIYDTYAKKSQSLQSVKDINDWAETCQWIALQIHSINNADNKALATTASAEQFVEFSAFYITDDTLYELRENSRFILENTALAADSKGDNHQSQWRYIDGDIIKHIELTKIKRKELCPCNNFSTSWTIKKAKKYKQCCGK